MEKRDPQTTSQPNQRDDRKENENRGSQRPTDSGSSQRGNAGQTGNPGQNRRDDSGQRSNSGDPSRDTGQTQARHPGRTSEQSGQDDDDDETSSTPGGNPARGAPGGTPTPTPAGSVREHQQPGCEGLCPSTGGTAGEAAGQTLGERDGSGQRPL